MLALIAWGAGLLRTTRELQKAAFLAGVGLPALGVVWSLGLNALLTWETGSKN